MGAGRERPIGTWFLKGSTKRGPGSVQGLRAALSSSSAGLSPFSTPRPGASVPASTLGSLLHKRREGWWVVRGGGARGAGRRDRERPGVGTESENQAGKGPWRGTGGHRYTHLHARLAHWRPHSSTGSHKDHTPSHEPEPPGTHTWTGTHTTTPTMCIRQAGLYTHVHLPKWAPPNPDKGLSSPAKCLLSSMPKDK